MGFQLLLILLLSPFAFIRWVRWWAIVQQKEYRIDRLSSFLKSIEGRTDALRLIPERREFTRTGMKRPVRTVRALLVGGISALLCIGIFGVGWMFGMPLGAAVFIYVFLPVIMFLSCVPSAVVAMIITWSTLWRAQQKIHKIQPVIIGVGGSYGKTSTKHLLHHILSQKLSVFVTPKSHNTKYSVAKSICTTYSDQQVALLEYGAYTRGEIEYLTQWFPPNFAIETGFTLQHLGLFGTPENSLLAESELVAALAPSSKAFCNGEDPGAVKICELGRQKNNVEIVYYSGEHSSLNFTDPQLNAAAELSFHWGKKKIQTRLVGKHYLVNAQAAAVVAQTLGLTDEEIIRGFETFTPNSSFILSTAHSAGGRIINDGGTSNPKGFLAAIQLIKEMGYKKSILITSGIVDLGDETSAVHAELAQAAEKVFDSVYYLGKDGKDEFKKEFEGRFVSEEMQVKKELSAIDSKTIVLIEGRVPGWVERIIT